MRQWVLFLAAVLVAGFASASASASYVGKPFPNFDATDPISRKRLELKDFRGQVVLVDFWATWCGPCVAEVPKLRDLHRKYKDQGFEIISISLDKDVSRCRSYVQSNGMNWVHVIDGGGWDTRLAKKYGIRSIPAMFLIDHEGVCVGESLRGASLERAVQDAIRKLPKDDSGASTGSRARSRAAATRNTSGEPLSPAALEQHLNELQQVEAEMEQTAAPLKSLAERIETAREMLGAAGEEAQQSLRKAVVDLRSELFASGLLNDVSIRLPMAAEDALNAMERPLRNALKQLEEAGKRAAALREEIQSGGLSAEQVRSQANSVAAACRNQVQRWNGAWQTQLDGLKGTGGGRPDGDGTLTQWLNDLEKRVADLRIKVAQRSSVNHFANREAFQQIREDLNKVCQRLCASGDPKCQMPGDPYENRAADHPAAIRELDGQLVKAAQAIRQMRPLAAKAAEEAKKKQAGFAGRIEAIQKELENARESAKIEEIRRRFVELCGELLAAGDRE